MHVLTRCVSDEEVRLCGVGSCLRSVVSAKCEEEGDLDYVLAASMPASISGE
jgi:hypothetical protein